jgi:hypothetical protein
MTSPDSSWLSRRWASALADRRPTVTLTDVRRLGDSPCGNACSSGSVGDEVGEVAREVFRVPKDMNDSRASSRSFSS